MKRLDECIDKESGIKERFPKTEKGKTFVLESVSGKHFYCQIIDVEGCVLKDEKFNGDKIKKCDWLFLVSKNVEQNQHLKLRMSKAFYVELKGVDIKSACEQLYNSIDKTKSQISNFEIVAKIISPNGYHPLIENNEFYRKVRRQIGKKIEFPEVNKNNKYTHVEKV